ncbi:MAG: retinol dehydrogenase-12 [Bacteroidia bacterium]|jgi:retinol dehydrogenase-12
MHMTGKVALVTGVTSGVGTATAEAIAQTGAELYMVCRNKAKGDAVLADIKQKTGNKNLHLLVGDLGAQADIRRVAKEFLDTGKPLQLLINNAGVVNMRRNMTVDGIEETFAVNHLAYFLLTELLRERIVASAPARIVSVASNAHEFCKEIHFGDISYERRKYKTFEVYGHSKLANILWTKEIAAQLEGSGVTANCVHPGAVRTGLGTQNGLLGKFITKLVGPFFRSPAKGAETSVYLATSDKIKDVSGQYFYNCKQRQAKPWARDDAAAKKLWTVSRELVGL